jgi:hypothetical protein
MDMKKKMIVSLMALWGAGLFFSAVLFADDMDKTAKELSSEIGKEAGLTSSEQESIDHSIKGMMDEGAGKEDIKNAVSGMINDGIRGEDLKNSSEALKELIKSGNSPTEAGHIVSQAVLQAQAEGLKGEELANRIQKAVKEAQALKTQQHDIYEKDRTNPMVNGQGTGHSKEYKSGAEELGVGRGLGNMEELRGR